jgi:hypothetical protein
VILFFRFNRQPKLTTSRKLQFVSLTILFASQYFPLKNDWSNLQVKYILRRDIITAPGQYHVAEVFTIPEPNRATLVNIQDSPRPTTFTEQFLKGTPTLNEYEHILSWKSTITEPI